MTPAGKGVQDVEYTVQSQIKRAEPRTKIANFMYRIEEQSRGLMRVTGVLRGLLSGPRANVPVLFHDAQGRELARAASDARGEFAVDLLAAHPVEVEARWPDWVKWGVYDADVFR